MHTKSCQCIPSAATQRSSICHPVLFASVAYIRPGPDFALFRIVVPIGRPTEEGNRDESISAPPKWTEATLDTTEKR